MTWTNDSREMRCRSSIDHLPAPQSAVKKRRLGNVASYGWRTRACFFAVTSWWRAGSPTGSSRGGWIGYAPKYHCPFRTRSAVHMTDRQQRFVMVGVAVGLVVLIHLAPLWFSER